MRKKPYCNSRTHFHSSFLYRNIQKADLKNGKLKMDNYKLKQLKSDNEKIKLNFLNNKIPKQRPQ